MRGALLLGLLFVAGLVAGIAIERARQPRQVFKTRLVSAMPKILDRLELSPPQRRAADSILARSNPRTEAAMREMVPRLAAIADSVQTELRLVLTPAQSARLDSLRGKPVLILKTPGPHGIRVDTLRP